MSLPGSVRGPVDEAIRRLHDDDDSVAATSPVSGGCINRGVRLDTVAGRTYFLKWNPWAPAGMFEAEADGLCALGKAAQRVGEDHRLRVPEPLARSEAPAPTAGPAWFLTSWLAPGVEESDGDERLGRGLALLHSVETTSDAGTGSDPTTPADAVTYGWHRDNWIGSLPQSNEPARSWPEFWRDRRILPQLEQARHSGYFLDSLMDELVDATTMALDDVEPSLLHGDLWSGNTYPTDEGRHALVDPAVYRGDAEVDLAMTELFGGFGPDFYAAYDDVRPISSAYRSHRRALYQLYYLLVHVNLFGRGYVAGCRRAAETVVAAVG